MHPSFIRMHFYFIYCLLNVLLFIYCILFMKMIFIKLMKGNKASLLRMHFYLTDGVVDSTYRCLVYFNKLKEIKGWTNSVVNDLTMSSSVVIPVFHFKSISSSWNIGMHVHCRLTCIADYFNFDFDCRASKRTSKVRFINGL